MRNTTARRAAQLGATALLLAGIGACSQSPAPQGSPATEVPEVGEEPPIDAQTLHVGVVNNPSTIHTRIAEQQGFFDDHNLDVEVSVFDNGAAIGAAIAGGSLDAGLLGGALPVLASQGAGTAFHMVLIEEDSVKIIAGPEVSSLEDLRGESVATTVGTTAHVVLYYALKSVGMTTDDIELVQTDQAGAVNAFVANQVDAIAVFPPNSTVALEQHPEAEQIASGKDFYPESTVYVGFLANETFLANDRDALVSFSAALGDANDYLLAEPENARAEVYEEFFAEDIDEETFNNLLDQFRLQETSEWAGQFESGEAREALGRLENVFVEIGAIDTFVDPDEWFDPSVFLDAQD